MTNSVCFCDIHLTTDGRWSDHAVNCPLRNPVSQTWAGITTPDHALLAALARGETPKTARQARAEIVSKLRIEWWKRDGLDEETCMQIANLIEKIE